VTVTVDLATKDLATKESWPFFFFFDFLNVYFEPRILGKEKIYMLDK
jgi:hypothetical protein